MSLAIAIWHGPESYSIVADTQIATHLAGIGTRASKLFRVGDWLGAWAGTMVSAQRLVREIGRHVDLDGTDKMDAALRLAWEEALTVCPSSEATHWRSVDVDVLLVGPAGVVLLSATGAIMHPPTREDGSVLGVIGCADEYVAGWMDRHGAADWSGAVAAVRAAASRYPGVGLPAECWRRHALGFESAESLDVRRAEP